MGVVDRPAADDESLYLLCGRRADHAPDLLRVVADQKDDLEAVVGRAVEKIRLVLFFRRWEERGT